jgi:hypothetical protein
MAMSDFPLDPATSGELRRLVSEVLAEVLTLPPVPRPPAPRPPAPRPLAPRSAVRPASAVTAGGIPSGVPAGEPASATPAGRRESDGTADGRPALLDGEAKPPPDFFVVRLGTDAELHEFALRVLRLADNPKMRRDLIGGRIRFRLAGETSGQAAAAARPEHRVDKGAVTERAVAAAASSGARLVLGPRAVLTPLAKDKARALGVPIERER